MLGDGAALIRLDLEDLFEPNWLAPERRIHELPRLVVFHRLHLLEHGPLPVLIVLCVGKRGYLLGAHEQQFFAIERFAHHAWGRGIADEISMVRKRTSSPWWWASTWACMLLVGVVNSIGLGEGSLVLPKQGMVVESAPPQPVTSSSMQRFPGLLPLELPSLQPAPRHLHHRRRG